MWIGFNSKSHLKIIYVGKLNETRSKHICVKNNSQKNIFVLYQLLMISDFSLIAKRIYSSSSSLKQPSLEKMKRITFKEHGYNSCLKEYAKDNQLS